MNDEQVFGLLVEVNPFPNVDVVSAPVETGKVNEGGPPMAIDTKRSSQREDHPKLGMGRGRRLLVAAAAVVTVLVAGAVIWATTGTGDDVADTTGMSTVAAAYEAMNNGDLAGFYAQLTERATEADDREARSLQIALHQQTDLLAPCRLLEPSPTTQAERVQCRATFTNDFFGAGGISVSVTDTFVIDEDGRIDVMIHELDRADADAYSQAFWHWFADAYPNDYIVIWPIGPDMLPTFDHPEGIIDALEHVDEFLDQSNEYPIPESG